MDSQRIMLRCDLGASGLARESWRTLDRRITGSSRPRRFFRLPKPSRSGSKLGKLKRSAASRAATPMPRLPPLNTRLEIKGPEAATPSSTAWRRSAIRCLRFLRPVIVGFRSKTRTAGRTKLFIELLWVVPQPANPTFQPGEVGSAQSVPAGAQASTSQIRLPPAGGCFR
jgi:hypothetical protein